MFIKISDKPERYVNTDNIEVLSFDRDIPTHGGGKTKGCIIDFKSNRAIPVSDAAGRVLLEFADANTAFEEYEPPTSGVKGKKGKEPTPPVAPLPSRIAQHLRDGAPNGAVLIDLVMMFPGNDAEIPAALDTLQAERVVMKVSGDAEILDRYYHASNVPQELRVASGEPSGF